MPQPTIGVLAVQGDVREHASALESLGAVACAIRRPSEVQRIDALVIPGGESTVIDKLTRAFGLADPIRERIAAGMPAYGSCAGLIMLADEVIDATGDQETFGGMDITVRRNAFGRQVDSFEADVHIVGLSNPELPFRGVFIRAPRIERAGPAVEIIATVPHEGGQAIVAARCGPLLVTSFHPEVTGDRRVHGLFLEMVADHRG